MPAMNADTAPMWRDLAVTVSEQRPSPGKRVRVTGGRKHVGKEGVVTRHEVNKYRDAFRYGGDANLHLREMMGRAGFRVCVEPECGEDPFWVDADKVEVIP